MIRTESLTKFYGSRCAVKDLSVSIADHEIVGFLGLNGAGKTTTLRMLAGLLAPSSGRIEIDGRDMAASNAADQRWRIGFLPDRPPLYEDMTVRSYLAFAAKLRGYANGTDRRVEEAIELCTIQDYADDVITNLSHGFRQRVGIAQAIIHKPALVILDEPTSGLDPVQIVEMRALIRNLKEHHTVLLSSHNLPEISQTCDRLLVVRDGELVLDGSESDLANRVDAGSRVRLVVSGAGEALVQALNGLKEEGIIGEVDRAERNGTFDLTVQLLVDEPEKLSGALFTAGLGLRRMQPQAAELESLFLELSRSAS